MKNLMGFFFAMVLVPASLWAATISGQVTRSGGGGATALSGAKVVLITTTLPARRLDSATTNAQGNYTLSNVTVGLREVQVTLAGYQTGTAIANVVSTAGTYTVNVALTALSGGGGNNGTVAGLVTSSVGNAPVANALVVLSRVGGNAGVLDSARTNAQGLYAFDSVAAQTNYAMVVTATGYQTLTRTGISVTANQTTTENFSLVTAASRVGALAGTVTNAAGNAAIANALVVLSRGGTGALDSARTNAQGVYAFDSVAVQTNYTMTVTVTGFHTAVATGVVVTGNATTTENFTLVAGTGGTTGSVDGTVSNSGQMPIANATVVLTRVGGIVGVAADTMKTDTQGHYLFSAVAAGTYRIAVLAAGYPNAAGNVTVAAGETVVSDFTLTSPTTAFAGPHLSQHFRTSWMEGRLALEFNGSSQNQIIEVFGMNGALLHRITAPAGITSVLLPSDITPASRVFLRVNGLSLR